MARMFNLPGSNVYRPGNQAQRVRLDFYGTSKEYSETGGSDMRREKRMIGDVTKHTNYVPGSYIKSVQINNSVQKEKTHAKRRWTEDEEFQLLTFDENETSFEEIARLLNRSLVDVIFKKRELEERMKKGNTE